MKQQVVVIHGGDSFKTHREYIHSLRSWPVSLKKFFPKKGWKLNLQSELGPKFLVLQPQMPNKSNARYAEWKIWFERMLPFVHQNVVLIGHSLGGMFLAKYLATTIFPKRIRAVILVAPPHNRTADIGDFKVPKSLHRIAKQTKNIFLFHSPDDPIVPFTEHGVYARALPQATTVVLKKRGHFSQEKFSELVRLVKKL